MPNGRTLDYATAPNGYGDRVGVQKTTYVAGLFGTGLASSNYAPPQTDPGADLTSWFVETSAGEPYDQNPLTTSVLHEIEQHHSSYYIDHSRPPAPLLISNGWTDDLFPVDEALRFYNRTKAEYPKAFVGLQFLDYGHSRGQNKAADIAVLRARQREFFDWFLKGQGDRPFDGVRVQTQACGAPSAGPYDAKTWKALTPGEVRLSSAPQQLAVSGGDPNAGKSFDPIAGGGACAKVADHFPGTASYRLPVTDAGGFTVLGAATVVADILSPSPNNQLAARLVDIAPDGQETLVARGTYRPDVTTSATRQVFQLHPAGWQFAKGHTAKLELLAFDAPYTRPSQGQSPVAVSNLELRLPVRQEPGGQVRQPAAKVVPAGYRLAPGY
jgi:predicted acyl esterase